jgi:hypothetical protein
MLDVGISCEGVPLAFGGIGAPGVVYTPCVCLLKMHRRQVDIPEDTREDVASLRAVASKLLAAGPGR